MSAPRWNIRFNVRVIMLIIGLASMLLPADAVLTGRLRYAAGFIISRSQEPVTFWALVAVMASFSVLIVFGALAKGRNDA